MLPKAHLLAIAAALLQAATSAFVAPALKPKVTIPGNYTTLESLIMRGDVDEEVSCVNGGVDSWSRTVVPPQKLSPAVVAVYLEDLTTVCY